MKFSHRLALLITSLQDKCRNDLIPKLQEIVLLNTQRVEERHHSRFPYIMLLLLASWTLGYLPIDFPPFLKWHFTLPLCLVLSQFLIACLPYWIRQTRLIRLMSINFLVEAFAPLIKSAKSVWNAGAFQEPSSLYRFVHDN